LVDQIAQVNRKEKGAKMSGKKHLIVIHGRASKPAHKEKQRLVKEALLHGLDRVDQKARAAVESEKVKFSFSYYGDISNRLLAERSKRIHGELTGKDPDHDNQPCQPAGSYDQDMGRMLAQQSFDKAAYKRFLKNTRDKRGLDEAAAAISWFANLINLNERIVSKVTPDMGAYLLTRKVGSEIRTRLQEPLGKALIDGDDVCLVSHSMGCIVSYDVLWKFSQMSEYREIQNRGNPVSLWLTLGNPLGEPGVRKNLYDANERDEGRFPKHIIRDWVNIAATDDFVSHDEKIADDFKDMLKAGYVNSIKDDSRGVYTFWSGKDGANAHKFYGYLDNPKVAQYIADWMNS
jgi:hypothetical protein